MADENRADGAPSLGRRELLKVLTSVPAAALIGVAPARAESRPTQSHPDTGQEQRSEAATYQPKALHPHEWNTIRVLSDCIIPADERSGSATEAGVPEFIDDWLALTGGVVLDVIRGGLTWLDAACNRQFGHSFANCSGAEQKQMLDRIAYPRTASAEDAPGVVFFGRLRELVISGFFSSEMGVKDLPYVGNRMVMDWEGCPPNVLAKIRERVEKESLPSGA